MFYTPCSRITIWISYICQSLTSNDASEAYIIIFSAETIPISCQGHEEKFSIYIHASKEKPVHVSRYFAGRETHSDEVYIFPWLISLCACSSSYHYTLVCANTAINHWSILLITSLVNSLYIQVIWGKISMVDAERRLLANALHDPDNQHFVLLSDRWF